MIQAAWRLVPCPLCNALAGERCKAAYSWERESSRLTTAHVSRIAAGKAKRKGRNVSGSRARR
jgi:hypothetical protein